MKVLLVEDDAETACFVRQGLDQSGHTVELARDGADGLFFLTGEEQFDLAIVDRRIPKLDGLSLVKAIRASGNRTPVLFLTTMDGVSDRVEGLEAGADDYLVKPFAFSELLARVNALMRRPPPHREQTVLRVADLEMDLMRRTVRRAQSSIDLLPREFRLLEYLMRHAGTVVTRAMLLEDVWGFHFDPRTSVIDTHVSRLRAKVDRPFEAPLIHTVRGAGYVLNAAQ